jgi:hypothetical protein
VTALVDEVAGKAGLQFAVSGLSPPLLQQGYRAELGLPETLQDFDDWRRLRPGRWLLPFEHGPPFTNNFGRPGQNPCFFAAVQVDLYESVTPPARSGRR